MKCDIQKKCHRFCNQSHEGDDLGDFVKTVIDKYMPSRFQDNIMCAGDQIIEPTILLTLDAELSF